MCFPSFWIVPQALSYFLGSLATRIELFAPIDVDVQDEDRRTPLHLAALFNYRGAVGLFLRVEYDKQHGFVAENHAKNKRGSILQLAPAFSAIEAAEILMGNFKGSPKQAITKNPPRTCGLVNISNPPHNYRSQTPADWLLCLCFKTP